MPTWPAPTRISFFGIVADALPEHRLDVADVGNRRRRIAVDDHQVRLLADRDAADARVAPRYFAPFSVAIVIASSGVKPASTSSSICR